MNSIKKVVNKFPAIEPRVVISVAESTYTDCIHVRLPCFALSDKEFEKIHPCEENVHAISGVYKESHIGRELMGKPTSFISLKMASGYTSVLATCAILAALYAGGPETIELPMASCLHECVVYTTDFYEKPLMY